VPSVLGRVCHGNHGDLPENIVLFVNADDWGRTEETTDRILTCYHQGRIHTGSAMTFMKDSERAAELAREKAFGVGLHLNLTQELTGNKIHTILRDHHRTVVAYLKSWRMAQVLYNPLLRRDFDYVFCAQWDEFCRLYEEEPRRLDGHLHMHLCMNMLFLNKYPKGLRVRRNFTFGPGEKGPVNRLYRHLVDRWVTSHFQCADFFLSIVPIEQGRLRSFILLSKSADVEIMVHPGVENEFHYLLSDDWLSLISSAQYTGSKLNGLLPK
jgi:predicted glycoside hydrolase/deacetylase ChbG (UPF0249 family)